MQFSSHCPYCLENVSSAMNGKAWKEASENHVKKCSDQIKRKLGHLQEEISMSRKEIEELKDWQDKMIREDGNMPALRDQLLLSTASEIRLRKALEEIAKPSCYADLMIARKALSATPTELASAITEMRTALNHYTPVGADCDCHLCRAKKSFDAALKRCIL